MNAHVKKKKIINLSCTQLNSNCSKEQRLHELVLIQRKDILHSKTFFFTSLFPQKLKLDVFIQLP